MCSNGLTFFRYIEIELGPYGHHIILLLDGVRNAIAKLLPIQYEATIGKDLNTRQYFNNKE